MARPEYFKFGQGLAEASHVEAIYFAILGMTRPNRTHLLAQGFPPVAIDHALGVLHFREVIDAHDPEEIRVFPPERAIHSYAARLEGQAEAVRGSARAAQQAYELARGDPDPEAVPLDLRRLEGLDEITAAAEAIEARVRTSLRAIVAGGPRLEYIIAGTHHAAIDPGDGPPIVREAIVDVSGFVSSDGEDQFASRASLGYDVRTGQNLPFNLLIIDDEVAIIDTTNRVRSGAGSLLVQNPVLVEILTSYFQRLHATAMPISAPEGGSWLGDRDRQVLTLMAAGLPDASIARRLGLSQRTIERRVAGVMGRLDATTRFQAGVKAARERLI